MVRLPVEYQEVEYLESTGNTQWIDTGIQITENLRFIIDFKALSTSSGRYIMGLYSSTNKSFYLYNSNYFQTAFCTSWYNTSLSCDTNRHRFEYLFENGALNVSENGSVVLTASASFSTSPEIFICGYKGAGNVVLCRTYKAEMYENNVLVGNFIPCYRKSDNEPGMYDTVSKAFYTNSGTGTFIKGNDVTYDPINLLEVRRRIIFNNRPNILYEARNLSFNGVDEYIDTGVYLFTQENINRDFEFIADGIVGTGSQAQNTIICAKYDRYAYGFLVRIVDDDTTKYKGTINIWPSPGSIVIKRINGVITLNGTNIKNTGVQFTNNVFDWPLVLGCAIDNYGNPYRYREGTIDHVCVRWL